MTFEVEAGEAGGRVDAVVAARLGAGGSRRQVQAWCDAGRVRVGGRRVSKSTRLALGDVVEVERGPERSAWAVAPAPDVPFVLRHEGRQVFVVEKPAGVASVGRADGEPGTLAGALRARWPELVDVGSGLECGLVHRLDTGTSGLVVVARTPRAWEALRAAWGGGGVIKQYEAWVAGHAPERGHVDAPIEHAGRTHMRAVGWAAPGSEARAAETQWRLRESRGDVSRLGVRIDRGVRHQVRVHLAWAGFPILGDALYGGPPAPRLMLHAARVAFDAPGEGRVDVESAPPSDFGPHVVSGGEGGHGDLPDDDPPPAE